MTREPLTDQQQALVRDNARLVSYAVNRFLRRGGRPAGADVDADDLRAEASFALCRAATLYDPARGQFSTYAVRAILLSIYRACNHGDHLKWKPPPCTSIETRIETRVSGPDSDCRLGDVLASSEPGPEERLLWAETLLEYEAAIRTLQPSLRGAMESIIAGETSGEYAARVGLSRSAGNERHSRARRTMRERVGP